MERKTRFAVYKNRVGGILLTVVYTIGNVHMAVMLWGGRIYNLIFLAGIGSAGIVAILLETIEGFVIQIGSVLMMNRFASVRTAKNQRFLTISITKHLFRSLGENSDIFLKI